MIPASYSVGNFKAIGATQTIPIRPITLIFGQNSAGKSSFIQSLLVCRHALEQQSFDFQVTRRWGPLVDLGGFRQYIHRHDADRDLIFEFGFHRSKLELEQSAAESESIRFLDAENANGFQNWSFCYLNGVREIALRFEVGLPNFSTLTRATDGARVKKLQLVLDGYRVVSFSLSPRGKLVLDDFSANAKPVIAAMRVLAADFVSYVRETEQETAGLEMIVERLGLESRQNGLESLPELPPVADAGSGPKRPRRRSDLRIFAAAVTERLGSVLRDFMIDGNGFALRQDPMSRLNASREEIEPRSVRAPAPRPTELEYTGPSLDQAGTAVETTTIEIEAIEGPVKFFAGEMEETDELDILAKAFRFDIELVLEGALASLDRWLTYVDYIAPFRETPDRYGSLSSGRVSDATCGVAADWARLAADPRLISEVNRLLAEKLDCPYQLVAKTTAPLVDYHALQEKLERLYETPQGRSRIASQSLAGIFSEMLGGKEKQGLNLIDPRNQTELDFCDVGFGISQVLPILIDVVAREKGIVCIEQPELHLHPRMQADLADIFIPKVEDLQSPTGKFFLLETHSEHLILRLLRRVRKSQDSDMLLAREIAKLDPRQVSVNYVKIEDGEARLTNIAITEDGDFDREWPEGFFDERAKELFG